MEYKDSQFLDSIHTQGTIIQRSCAGTSQQNGRVERKHRHILDFVRAFLISSSCPKRFWGEAALTAFYTINRLPSPALQNLSHFERLYGTPPSYILFTSLVVHVLFYFSRMIILILNLDLVCVVFLGMRLNTKTCCWDPISQHFRISRHAVFSEHTTFSSFSKFKACSTLSFFFINPSLPLFSHDTSPNPSAILPIPLVDSLVLL